MITGEIPFMGRTHAQITGMVGYYHETLKLAGHFNADLRKIANLCMAVDPERRPSFENIIIFITKKFPREDKGETVSPMMNKLFDFLN